MVYKRHQVLEIETLEERYHGCRLVNFETERGSRKCTILSRTGMPYASARQKLQRTPTVGEVLKEIKLLSVG